MFSKWSKISLKFIVWFDIYLLYWNEFKDWRGQSRCIVRQSITNHNSIAFMNWNRKCSQNDIQIGKLSISFSPCECSIVYIKYSTHLTILQKCIHLLVCIYIAYKSCIHISLSLTFFSRFYRCSISLNLFLFLPPFTNTDRTNPVHVLHAATIANCRPIYRRKLVLSVSALAMSFQNFLSSLCALFLRASRSHPFSRIRSMFSSNSVASAPRQQTNKQSLSGRTENKKMNKLAQYAY